MCVQKLKNSAHKAFTKPISLVKRINPILPTMVWYMELLANEILSFLPCILNASIVAVFMSLKTRAK